MEARDARHAERDRLKREERVFQEAKAAKEQEAAEEVATAEIRVRAAAEHARIARVVEDEAARKAERDNRYTIRKARQAWRLVAETCRSGFSARLVPPRRVMS